MPRFNLTRRSLQSGEKRELQIGERTNQVVRRKREDLHTTVAEIANHSKPTARVQGTVPIVLPGRTRGRIVQGKKRGLLVRKKANNNERQAEDQKQSLCHEVAARGKKGDLG